MATASPTLQTLANRIWYGSSKAFLLLLPFSLLFGALAALRRFLYRLRILPSRKVPVPVVVVGNITVGGTGKTPVTLWLSEQLRLRGFVPAIVSRGYGGQRQGSTRQVTADSDPALVGDEPVLLATRSGCDVYVDSNRVRAAETAASRGATVVIADDGLQHYRLRRDAEIAVIDGSRGLGNGYLLPAGPLREPEQRLATVLRILVQTGVDGASSTRYGNRAKDRRVTRFQLKGENLHRIGDSVSRPIAEFHGKTMHAVAGIANPDRFFDYLEHHGIDVVRHPLPDHAAISAGDVQFGDELDVVVTEKDAVKCRAFPHIRLWYLPVDVTFDQSENMYWLESLQSTLTAASDANSDG